MKQLIQKQIPFLLLCAAPLIMPLSGCIAQQDALYSQYMFNPFVLNPAYAGSRQSVSAILLYRKQWLGIDGAPESESFSIHMPMKGSKVALGFNAFNEKIGPSENVGVFGTYAYHLPVASGKLSMALKAGLYRLQFNGNLLDFKDKTDKNYNASVTNGITPSFDFGIYYYTYQFFAGTSVTHITQQEMRSNGPANIQGKLRRHFILTTGNAFVVKSNFILKPSVMLRYTFGAPANIDLNMSCLIRKILWIGASYRTSNDIIMITEFNITSYLRAGYSYDLGLGELKKYNGGSHEIFIGMDFDILKPEIISPRYL